MANLNYEKLIKSKEIQLKLDQKQRNTIKTRSKAKLNTEVFEVGQKVKVSNCIRILNNSIFV